MYYFPTSTLFVSFAIGIFYWLQQVLSIIFTRIFVARCVMAFCYCYLLAACSVCIFHSHAKFHTVNSRKIFPHCHCLNLAFCLSLFPVSASASSSSPNLWHSYASRAFSLTFLSQA